MRFEDLNLSNPILNALNDRGFTTPTPIQERVFSKFMSGVDFMGIAQTGTGKTLAYLLPALRLWKFTKSPLPQVLIVVPTRELVIQVVEEIEKLTPYMNTHPVGVYGGANINTQAQTIMQGLDFLVATPGRLLDLLLNGILNPKNIKKLIIDEVDEMLDLGFRQQLVRLMDMLPEQRQNVMFSATMTEEVETFIADFFGAVDRVEAAPVGTPLANINQSVYEVPNFNTKRNLLHILLQDEEMKKVLIFASNKRMADSLYDELVVEYGEQVGVIHSNKAQNNRFNTVKDFKEDRLQYLIATDVVARGIDIEGVTHVINFDIPEVPENYMHRIGRTGRADRTGQSIAFVGDRERESMAMIEELMSMKVDRLPNPEDLVYSDVLVDAEKPVIKMKNILVKTKKRDVGPAFHEKKLKNQKVNMKKTRAEKMKEKYKKPKTRGQKR
ncbi:DEAD/DEAH box helicase [Halosquirtibacter xylanolyticus]|uniref:DEAD/DEAH box helicase n=1 Tax=Halosquirtibacter xylanolyticus TaxID=3374599 RepID=UPI00374A1ED9|nr:DEAD/DEAH box helicase [Prolixibacteraceae bacterium]